jgi:D-alanyl-lipoteichoic acid acyltransferase DltB (MBOAT superfamily)
MLPHRQRWFLLLAASCYFYMVFFPVYILILGFTIIIDYFAGIWIEKAQGRKRKLFLSLSLVANIGVLAIFKYYNFLNDIVTDLLGGIGVQNNIPYLSILLPVGLSFHTFQAMSYNIEVYRGHQKAERNFGIYSLYVMFYPQLVAGPIERPQNLLHQFREKHNFDYDRIVAGLRQMLWGFFKKIVIADRLAIYVNSVYDYPEAHGGYTFILATFFFAFQIYCDFSGYSDIAIGAARVMGFKLMTNFNRPYFSQSISEFWKRWHISLSTWFKDYLYVSLGGNRVSVPRWYLNLFIVFLVSGLWHGANWTFVIWGALNGIYLICALIVNPWFNRMAETSSVKLPGQFSSFFNIGFTFTLTCLAWVFFRASTVDDAFLIVSKMLQPSGSLFIPSLSGMIYAFFGLAILLLYEIKKEYFDSSIISLGQMNVVYRYAVYSFLILLILLIGVFDSGQFIYFQF